MSVDQIVKKAPSVISNAGFIILYTIDLSLIMKEQLGLDLKQYMIVGVSSPATSNRMLEIDQNAGLLIPSNIVIYETTAATVIGTIRPTVVLSVLNNDLLKETALLIENKLKDIIDSL